MKAATLAGVASTIIFAGSTLPMVVRAARTRDVSSYSRGHLVMTNAGNAVHTVYIASLPPGPVWLLHGVHTGVAAFMFAAHLRWAPIATPRADGVEATHRQVSNRAMTHATTSSGELTAGGQEERVLSPAVRIVCLARATASSMESARPSASVAPVASSPSRAVTCRTASRSRASSPRSK